MKRYARALVITILLVNSLIFYFASSVNLLFASLFSSFSFWLAISLLVPKGFYHMVWREVNKTKAYWISFALYLFFHVTLYGIFYNMILGGFLFFPYFGYGIGASVPPPLYLFVYWTSTSPAFFTFIGPYESDVSPYTIFLGIILALLIGANIEKILELRRLINERRRSLSALVAVPSLGIVSGTSCCLSLPSILIYIAAVSTGTFSSVVGILSSPIFFFFTYFGLPVGSILLLFFNLRDMNRIIARLKSCPVESQLKNKKR